MTHVYGNSAYTDQELAHARWQDICFSANHNAMTPSLGNTACIIDMTDLPSCDDAQYRLHRINSR